MHPIDARGYPRLRASRLYGMCVAPGYVGFDASRERSANAKVRELLHRVIRAVTAAVDTGTADARQKAKHYVGALRLQLQGCDSTDGILDSIEASHDAT